MLCLSIIIRCIALDLRQQKKKHYVIHLRNELQVHGIFSIRIELSQEKSASFNENMSFCVSFLSFVWCFSNIEASRNYRVNAIEGRFFLSSRFILRLLYSQNPFLCVWFKKKKIQCEGRDPLSSTIEISWRTTNWLKFDMKNSYATVAIHSICINHISEDAALFFLG